MTSYDSSEWYTSEDRSFIFRSMEGLNDKNARHIARALLVGTNRADSNLLSSYVMSELVISAGDYYIQTHKIKKRRFGFTEDRTSAEVIHKETNEEPSTTVKIYPNHLKAIAQVLQAIADEQFRHYRELRDFSSKGKTKNTEIQGD